MLRLEGTHQEICTVDLVARSTVRVVRLCDGDVVEWTHERSERRYRRANQRPRQPYLDVDSGWYERKALVFRVDRLRESSHMHDGESDHPRLDQNEYTRSVGGYSRESECKSSHNKHLRSLAYQDARNQVGRNDHERSFCDDVEYRYGLPSRDLSRNQWDP